MLPPYSNRWHWCCLFMHVYGDAYIYGQHSIFPASNSAFIFNDLVRVSTADQFTRSCNMAILIFSGGADFKLYGRGIFLLICSVPSSVSILQQQINLEVPFFICSVMTKTYLCFLQFLHYLYRRTGTGSSAGRKCRSAVHGTHRHISTHPFLLPLSFAPSTQVTHKPHPQLP